MFLESKRYHYMAGLPRSGSTLLSSLLNQNPKFLATPSSPLTGAMLSAIQGFQQNELFQAYSRQDAAKKVITNMLPSFYEDESAEVIIEKNRSWTNNIQVLQWYINPNPKIICPVRNIEDILSSFLGLIHRNPLKTTDTKINFIDEMLIKTGQALTDQNRCTMMLSSEGILGQSFIGMKNIYEAEGGKSLLHFVEYNQLVTKPEETMAGIYEFLGEEPFKHEFTDITNINQEADGSLYGLSDMHEVRPTLGFRQTPMLRIPENISEAIKGQEFWRA